MNTNVVISLDTRYKKKDGTYNLIMRLGHNERTLPIPLHLKISLKEADWDEDKRVIKKSYPDASSVTRLNTQIQKKRLSAMELINQLQEQEKLQGLPIDELKKRIMNASSSDSFKSFTEAVILNLREAKKYGTADAYKDAKNALIKFSKNSDPKFSEITSGFLKKWETSHLSKGNSINGLAAYLRSIRAIYNLAIDDAIASKDSYPFADYKIKTKPTEKRALDIKLLNKIIKKKLVGGHEFFHARNYFLVSYMMYGMNFKDMAYFKKDNIADGRIYYRRTKTSRLFDIKITANLEKILSYYLNLDPLSPYVFPILKSEESMEMHYGAKWARNRYNSKLDEMGKFCGIDKKLTSYVSRHSFATQAMLIDIPINAISSMLGHTSIKTTEIYLQTLPNSILDKYNAKLVKGI